MGSSKNKASKMINKWLPVGNGRPQKRERQSLSWRVLTWSPGNLKTENLLFGRPRGCEMGSGLKKSLTISQKETFGPLESLVKKKRLWEEGRNFRGGLREEIPPEG